MREIHGCVVASLLTIRPSTETVSHRYRPVSRALAWPVRKSCMKIYDLLRGAPALHTVVLVWSKGRETALSGCGAEAFSRQAIPDGSAFAAGCQGCQRPFGQGRRIKIYALCEGPLAACWERRPDPGNVGTARKSLLLPARGSDKITKIKASVSRPDEFLHGQRYNFFGLGKDRKGIGAV